jgi:serine/threonine-protein kinase
VQALLPDGRQVAGYRLLRELGRGAHGVVWLAAPADGSLPVALKLSTLPGGGDADALAARAAFLDSAASARQLRHAGIVALLQAGVEGDTGWLAMEAVPGTDLGRYTVPSRLLPEPLVLRVAERIAEALAYAHMHGVVHRDLKPANVLVHWPSDSIKLADFGLARSGDAARTATGLVLGTPAYMAPEQLAGNLPTPRTDLYALGALLFQLLLGRLPHEAASMGELLRRVAREPAPALRSLRPELPAALESLVAELLHKSPARRPADAQALAARLRTLAAGWPAAREV